MCEKSIGKIIAEAREKKGLSQRQLAKLAKISNAELSKIEAGIRKDPNPKTLRKISNFIDVNFRDLMVIIGLFVDVSVANPFIKQHYENMNLEQLYEAELDILGEIRNHEKLLDFCKNNLDDKNLLEKEKVLLLNTINELEYFIRISNEIIKFIQSRMLVERNKIGLKF